MLNEFSLPNKDRIKTILIYGFYAAVAFTCIYGLCNHLASLNPNRYSMFTEWELSIPLIPWMIYPYLSLNLLFLIAPFLVKDVTAIKALCISLIWGSFIAGIIFYFWPGELGFTRVTVEGYEHIFNPMFEVDNPHNLFPSLHVTYSTLTIWVILEQTNNKILHLLLWCWLLAIISSVVFVHQHHLFDVLTGFILAVGLHQFVIKKYHKFDRG